MRYYIITGERSGDMHGSELVKSIKDIDKDAIIYAWGGEQMQKAGAKIRKHYNELSYMGFVEVIKHIRKIKENFNFCKKDIDEFKPDAVIFIDYPGFNLRMAPYVKNKKIKTFYYIMPQIWAWKENRIKIIKKYIDKAFVILPFEKDFYNKKNYYVEFVGHPLAERILNFKKNYKLSFDEFIKINKLENKKIIAILPGSRKQEIIKSLPIMSAMANHFTDYQFVIAANSSFDSAFYNFYSKKKLPLLFDKSYELLNFSTAALVTSGTATLETALFYVPQVVCYKGNYLSYLIAKALIKVKFISLVNLIENDAIVKELIQNDFNIKNLKKELNKIINDNFYKENILTKYKNIFNKIYKENVSKQVAKSIFEFTFD